MMTAKLNTGKQYNNKRSGRVSENKMDLWNRVLSTDPAHVKQITGKSYKGNSPKPYYIVKKLTEEFGPCGIGWGFDIKSQENVNMLDGQTIVNVATVEMWYKRDGNSVCTIGRITQVGQTKFCYMSKGGDWVIDEDAPKKSVTDALVKCASYLGFAGDIFMGMWNDSKYVEGLKEEFSEEARKAEVLLRADSIEELNRKAAFVADWQAKFDECATLQDVAKAWTDFKVACNPEDGDSIQKVGMHKKGIVEKLKAEAELEKTVDESKYQ